MGSLNEETLKALDSVDIDELRQDTYKEIAASGAFDYIDEELSYDEFFRLYLLPNRPCLLGPWATRRWRARREWATTTGTPHLDFLASNFGEAVVPVADCGQEQYSSHPKHDMKLSQYIDYLRQAETDRHSSLYLKDWHHARHFPDYEAYSTPAYFTSDWLNEFWDTRSDDHDDYRFVYIGPKGSWTPFHADVLRSYSWSANVCGLKLWWFYPPGEEDNLRDRLGQLPYDLRSSDMYDIKKYPHYSESEGRRIEVVQRPGEVIFVPSGWHHQVFNQEDTISINHNWLNACCVDLSWRFVKASLRDVQKEISDLTDMDGWDSQCQLILKATSGIDYAEFYRFLHTIADSRIKTLTSTSQSEANPQPQNGTKDFSSKPAETGDPGTSCDRFNPHQTGSNQSLNNHYRFDLQRLELIVKDMMNDKEFKEIDFATLPEHPEVLCERIRSVL